MDQRRRLEDFVERWSDVSPPSPLLFVVHSIRSHSTMKISPGHVRTSNVPVISRPDRFAAGMFSTLTARERRGEQLRFEEWRFCFVLSSCVFRATRRRELANSVEFESSQRGRIRCVWHAVLFILDRDYRAASSIAQLKYPKNKTGRSSVSARRATYNQIQETVVINDLNRLPIILIIYPWWNAFFNCAWGLVLLCVCKRDFLINLLRHTPSIREELLKKILK